MSAGLNIAALARRTGVAPDTLRKWEQRYGILQPSRTAGGQRRYDERDVARVEWLCARVREGYRIREAASLLGRADVDSSTDYAQAVLDAVAGGAHDEVGPLVDQAIALHGVEAALEDVLTPLLHALGDRSIGDEHVVSEAVRTRLAHLLTDGDGVHGRVVLACAPGEQHELGLMMVGIRLRRDGWGVTYLGADTPFEDALDVASRVAARLVGISVTMPERADALSRPARADIGVVVGGQAATPALARRLGAATSLHEHAA